MTDTAPDTGTDAITDASTNGSGNPADVTDTDTIDWKAEAEKHKALARKHEDRAKANAAAAKELEQLKASSMSDQEKAVAEAKAAGRAEALAEAGTKVVVAEFRAAAAGRLDADALATLIDGLNLAAFLDANGDVDTDRVQAFMDGIAPAADPLTPVLADLGQGARNGKDVALNGDPLLNAVKDKLGVRR